MKVLLLAPHAFYIDRGTPIDVDILARALSNRGDQVDLVAYNDGERRDYPGLTIHRAGTPSWLVGTGPGFSLKKMLSDWWLFRKASRLAKQTHYDVIHADEESVFMAMWLKRRRGIPYIYDMDSSIAQQMVEKFSWLKPFAGFFNWCESKAVRGAVAVAPVCNALADLAKERGAQLMVTLHDISQLSFEQDPPAEDSIRARYGIEGVLLMYVGNLEPYQGIDLLLEAMAKVDPAAGVTLIIAGGSEPLIDKYRQKADSLDISEKTHFIGPWPADRLAELISQADILTAPRTKGVNTPMKVFPYLHAGRAVLVTDLPTHTQVLDSTVCELAPAEPGGFARSIEKLARDADLRQQLGAAGRSFAKNNHTFDAHQRRVNELYRAVGETIDTTRTNSEETITSAQHG